MTLLDEIVDDVEDDRKKRTIRARGDVAQTHLSARWWE